MNDPETQLRVAGHDETNDVDRDPFDLVAEEFADRCRRGESPSISEYEARHPEYVERIRKLLPTVAMMEQLKRDSQHAGGSSLARPAPERLGEFRVIRELGRGGMGVVYEAVQESLGRHVALKVIHHLQLDFKRLQRFQRETQAIAQLHHTNIVPIFGVGEDEGLPYYVMQLIDGSGLDALLAAWRQEHARAGADRWRFVARVGLQAADALEYAHQQGVLHRDIKPANLLIDGHQVVWITDFGLAKLTGQNDLTASGDIVGTLRYLAPEALHGESNGRSDVYSLGLTLYEMLTLQPPFGELSASELLRHVSEGEPVRPRSLAPEIPRDLETIVLKATAREPRHRYATAAALAEDLKRFLEDRPIRARRATVFERVWRWSRRNRLAAAMATATAGSLLLTAVVGWLGYMRTTRALEDETRHRGAAEVATSRAEQNVALSLEAFDALFDHLAPSEDNLDPPLGQPPRRGRDNGPPPPPPPPPPGFGGDPFGPRRPPGDDDGGPPEPPRQGPDGGPPGPPPDGPGGGGRSGPPPPDEPDRGRHGRERRGLGGRPGHPPGTEEDTALLESVLTFYDRFARQNATNPRLQGEAAWAYRRMGDLYARLDRFDEASDANARALAMLEELVQQFPNVSEYRSKLVDTYIMVDPWSTDPAALPALEKRLLRARELVDRLVAEAPNNLDHAQAQVHVYGKLGATLQRLDRKDEAERAYRVALDVGGKLISRSPLPARARYDRADALQALAILLNQRGRTAEAKPLLDSAAADLLALANGDQRHPPLGRRFASLRDLFRKLDEPKRAEEMAGWADVFDRSSFDGQRGSGGPGRDSNSDRQGRPRKRNGSERGTPKDST